MIYGPSQLSTRVEKNNFLLYNMKKKDNLFYNKRIMILEDRGSQTTSGDNTDTQSSQNRSISL